MLRQLHQTLSQSGAAALNQAQAIYGLGGIGKTQTAVEYAYRYFYDEPNYNWVFWVTADTEFNLTTGLGNLAEALALPERATQNLDEKVKAVQRWLQNHKDWLLIFDNADQPDLLKPFRPKNPHGRVLITSRAQVFDDIEIAHPVEVPEMEPTEAEDFLFRRTEQKKHDPTEVAAANQLAKELGYLPLALEQAGAYIYQKKISFTDYLTSYRQRRLALLQRQLPKTGNYPESVATTWSLNFQAVENSCPAAAELLRFSAFLSSDKIPQELLVRGATHLGEGLSAVLIAATDDPLILPDLLEPLTRYSLIRLESKIACYTIHRMVQEVLRDGMNAVTQQQWVSRAVAALYTTFPQPEFQTWADCARLVAHVQAVVEQHHPPDSINLATLLNQTGYYLHDQGRYSEAEPLLVRSLSIREQQLGADHPDVAASLNNLAGLYESQGRYSKAEPLLVRSLSILEQQLGADHPAVAASLNNLAGLYQHQGRYSEAEPLLERSLSIREQQLGADHPAVATSLNNLALLYQSQGRYSEAEPLFVRSLSIREQQLGADHPAVATSLNNLAELYKSQGRYSKAEPLYLRTLAIFMNVLGENHPNTQTVQGNFRYLVQQAVEAGQAGELSDHPATQAVLREMMG